MRIETTKDVIVQSKKFHHLLADYYQSLSVNSDKARFKLLLDYLEERERTIEETLSDLELSLSPKVLNTWFSHSNCREKFIELSNLVLKGSPSIEYVIDEFVRIDNCLIELYSMFAERSNNADTRAFFSNLVKLEENHQIKALKNAAQVEDL